jgi:hypothetical protein
MVSLMLYVAKNMCVCNATHVLYTQTVHKKIKLGLEWA